MKRNEKEKKNITKKNNKISVTRERERGVKEGKGVDEKKAMKELKEVRKNIQVI